MAKALNFSGSTAARPRPTASVVDGMLILSLPDAIDPVVWQMELGQTRASAIEVRSLSTERFMLVLKTARADVQDIAAYSTREGAVTALLTLTAALEKAKGSLRPYTGSQLPVPVVVQTPGPAPIAPKRGWMLFALGLLAIGVLSYFLVRLVTAPIQTLSHGSVEAPAEIETAPIENGEPASADDFLNEQP